MTPKPVKKAPRKAAAKATRKAPRKATRKKAASKAVARRDWKPDFLDTLKIGGHVVQAATAAGITKQAAYKARHADEDFALAWADAIDEATETLERVAVRRATAGTERPVFYKGEVVGTIREMSDTLLIFLLKARRPDVYRDNAKIEHEHFGTVKQDVVVQVVPEPERRAEVARVLEQAYGDRDS